MAPRLDKMILDALEEVANKSRKPIDEVLRATQTIIENNIVKEEPVAVDEAPAQAAPVAAPAKTVTKVAATTPAPNASVPAPAAGTEGSAPSKKRSAPKPVGSEAKRAAPKVKSPASDSDTVRDEPANISAVQNNTNNFPCEFSHCSRVFAHKSSRTRHYKLNHNGQTA
ncbi:hypothetical protein LY78DRAFT_712166 [Colletotrichum sublineola]|uniref:C2H2-type domain-containing protein n=1 Tax=Colletotrichum sublineola TaxID=1173701 RepID=A0A066XQZ6_COLSU|nr:hypothetical protein LY78DRAFT_712166 [Colletotrichum sublineola]KDN71282.1 hypothetical protein CSUB01_08450 [Colletotrichum sublineola]